MGWEQAEGDSGPEAMPARAITRTNGGASHDAPDRPPVPRDSTSALPRADDGSNGGGLSTGGSPPMLGLEPGPSMRQEGCLYAHSPRGRPAAR